MKNNRIKTCSLIALGSVALLLYSGCASSIDRGSLSEAVEKASDKNEGDRRVTGHGTDRTDDEETSSCLSSCLFSFLDNSNDDVAPSPTYQPSADRETVVYGPSYVGFREMTSNRFSRNYTHSTGIGLLWINHYEKRRALELALQGEVITTGEKSKLFGSIDQIFDIEAGVHWRRYSTPDFTSVVLDDQGDTLEVKTIQTDGLFGINADIGVGWSFVQTKRVKVSLELLAGGTVFWFKTFEAFRNDMFYPDGYIKAGVEVLFGTGNR
jgi:hypothetical protein